MGTNQERAMMREGNGLASSACAGSQLDQHYYVVKAFFKFHYLPKRRSFTLFEWTKLSACYKIIPWLESSGRSPSRRLVSGLSLAETPSAALGGSKPELGDGCRGNFASFFSRIERLRNKALAAISPQTTTQEAIQEIARGRLTAPKRGQRHDSTTRSGEFHFALCGDGARILPRCF
jgi:hypothetical protein